MDERKLRYIARKIRERMFISNDDKEFEYYDRQYHLYHEQMREILRKKWKKEN